MEHSGTVYINTSVCLHQCILRPIEKPSAVKIPTDPFCLLSEKTKSRNTRYFIVAFPYLEIVGYLPMQNQTEQMRKRLTNQ
jgi:hypothetical protein